MGFHLLHLRPTAGKIILISKRNLGRTYLNVNVKPSAAPEGFFKSKLSPYGTAWLSTSPSLRQRLSLRFQAKEVIAVVMLSFTQSLVASILALAILATILK